MDRVKEGGDLSRKLQTEFSGLTNIAAVALPFEENQEIKKETHPAFSLRILETYPTPYNGGIGVVPMQGKYCDTCLSTQRFHDLETYLVCERCTRRKEKVLPQTDRQVLPLTDQKSRIYKDVI